MARRGKGRNISGVLLLNKPKGISSNRALQRVRAMFNASKAGHTGNLDPMATGLLPLCFGEATKFSSYLLDADKAYIATARLGLVSDTGDAEGTIIQERPVPELSDAQICDAMAKFLGDIEQVPPMYSALKQNGQPLYKLAREGKTVERKARAVTIFELKLLEWDAPDMTFSVRCSKGTYVRTLAEDIGETLGCGAHLVMLHRTHTGGFDASGMLEFDRLQSERDQDQSLDGYLLDTDVLVAHFPKKNLSAEETARILHGQDITCDQVYSDKVRLYDEQERFIGLAESAEAGRLKPRRLVVFEEQ
ncbi:tRNA pseudouridine(55) synthase TruB [Oceanospirillum linum]|uniref:tRNA pseudouridine synthase B n=1 Tax=Oceanospirillum linum TaxID=966 RepID=A0A1T1H8S2_OCELI|nr:tRNA pseudouridine(55) synthase TruB [Oceanospirillum linum]OOV86232.1 tRNA pseudouridine(55) synthase TruB [Oceanospirillum linum]SEG37765.1 tRNA pseudouridine synthase B [Oleiphilus messinensis]SMP32242.1 tRNA pseudouridine synthase B [Oceanospirillum linum]